MFAYGKWLLNILEIPMSSEVNKVFKVVRNSFPFSIPTELYERLTRL